MAISKNTILIGRAGEKWQEYELFLTNLGHKNVHLRTEFEKIEERKY